MSAAGVDPLLEVRDLEVAYPGRARVVGSSGPKALAVAGVSFDVAAGETVAVVGESGSGKTTIGRAILRLVEPTGGSVRFRGREVLDLKGRALTAFRREAQMVFQDPYASLNPRLRVGRSIEEPLTAQRIGSADERRARVASLLEMVGLPADAASRYPHAFSGGQRQRICIARALALDPALLVADEPLSALDVSVQAQVANVLRGLRRELGLTMVFIAHDLAVVRHLADRVLVLYSGRVMELGTRDEVFGAPAHPYTRALLSAAPEPDPVAERARERIVLRGDPPGPLAGIDGCVFSSRCPEAIERCRVEVPELRVLPSGRQVSCHLVESR